MTPRWSSGGPTGRSRSPGSTRRRPGSAVCSAEASGLATGLVVVLFPFAAVGGGLLAVTTGGGAVLGAVAGHAAAGIEPAGPQGTRRAPGRRTGRPGRGRGVRHGRKGRAGDEEGQEGGSPAVEGRHRRQSKPTPGQPQAARPRRATGTPRAKGRLDRMLIVNENHLRRVLTGLPQAPQHGTAAVGISVQLC